MNMRSDKEGTVFDGIRDNTKMQLEEIGGKGLVHTHRKPSEMALKADHELPSGSRSLLKAKAYDEIKKKIMDEEFPPGTFLAERKLAMMLGMSKTPVKSALERLAVEGFVTISPQQCILVRELPMDEIADQYEIRTALETHVVRGLAKRITASQKVELRDCLAFQRKNWNSVKVAQWVDLDADFHLLLAKQFGNQAIIRVMLDLRDRMHRVITRVFHLQPMRLEESITEHQAIVDAIALGNSEDASSLVSAHLQRGRDLVLAPRR